MAKSIYSSLLDQTSVLHIPKLSSEEIGFIINKSVKERLDAEAFTQGYTFSDIYFREKLYGF